jgi:hypothetical protein
MYVSISDVKLKKIEPWEKRRRDKKKLEEIKILIFSIKKSILPTLNIKGRQSLKKLKDLLDYF